VWEGVQKDIEINFHEMDIPDSTKCPSSRNPKSITVGGHADAFKAGPEGVIQKVAEPTELAFYEAAFFDGAWPTHFLPSYHGTAEAEEGETLIRLQNLMHGFRRPCVLDLKMGQQTYLEGEAKLRKRLGLQIVDHITGSSETGVRLVGMKVYKPYRMKEFRADKKAGLVTGADHTISEVLAFFLSDGKRIRAELVEAFYRRLVVLVAHFESQQRYTFTGSSLLFVYDGHKPTNARLERFKLAGAKAVRMSVKRANPFRSIRSSASARKRRNVESSGHTPASTCVIEEPTFASVAVAVARQDHLNSATLPRVHLRMIDFAKTFPVEHRHTAQGATSAPAAADEGGSGADPGYTRGLRSLIVALEALRNSDWALWPEAEKDSSCPK